jgi:hypothetical protein
MFLVSQTGKPTPPPIFISGSTKAEEMEARAKAIRAKLTEQKPID